MHRVWRKSSLYLFRILSWANFVYSELSALQYCLLFPIRIYRTHTHIHNRPSFEDSLWRFSPPWLYSFGSAVSFQVIIYIKLSILYTLCQSVCRIVYPFYSIDASKLDYRNLMKSPGNIWDLIRCLLRGIDFAGLEARKWNRAFLWEFCFMETIE